MMKEHVTENVQKATQMFDFQMKQSMIPSATNQKIINETGVLIDKVVPGIEQMEAPMLNDIADHKFPADESVESFSSILKLCKEPFRTFQLHTPHLQSKHVEIARVSVKPKEINYST